MWSLQRKLRLNIELRRSATPSEYLIDTWSIDWPWNYPKTFKLAISSIVSKSVIFGSKTYEFSLKMSYFKFIADFSWKFIDSISILTLYVSKWVIFVQKMIIWYRFIWIFSQSIHFCISKLLVQILNFKIGHELFTTDHFISKLANFEVKIAYLLIIINFYPIICSL